VLFLQVAQSAWSALQANIFRIVDPTNVDVLSTYLEDVGFGVVLAPNVVHSVVLLLEARPDIVLLDGTLPKLSGCEVLHAIRLSSDVPVIMVTARADEIDRIVGLELGADDYVDKACCAREFVARVRAVLRRSQSREHWRSVKHDVLRFDSLEIDGLPTRFAATGTWSHSRRPSSAC
jgi:DNA-binding response OmpR family regulator